MRPAGTGGRSELIRLNPADVVDRLAGPVVRDPQGRVSGRTGDDEIERDLSGVIVECRTHEPMVVQLVGPVIRSVALVEPFEFRSGHVHVNPPRMELGRFVSLDRGSLAGPGFDVRRNEPKVGVGDQGVDQLDVFFVPSGLSHIFVGSLAFDCE